MSFKEFLNIYEFETILPGSGETIRFKPVTTGELKKLLVYENEENESIIEEALDRLISSSVENEDFDIKNLYLQDRFFLLIEIRKKTKGESYNFTHNCKKCKSQTLQKINLNDLKVKKFEKEISKNVFVTENISVNLKHITRKDQIEAFLYIGDDKIMSKLQKSTEAALYTYASGIEAIITPNGKEENINIPDKKYLLENISTGSYDKIKEWYEENNFGIDFKYKIKCIHCGNEETIEIPLDNFFF